RRVRWRCDCRCTGLHFHDCAWIEQRRPWKCSHPNAASVYTGRHQDDPWQDGQGLSEGWPVHLTAGAGGSRQCGTRGKGQKENTRRTFLHLAAGAPALPVISRAARAQAYPTQPVRIIVGVAPGGPTDILARLLAQWLSERLAQQFLVENRPGAGTNIATEAVVRAP